MTASASSPMPTRAGRRTRWWLIAAALGIAAAATAVVASTTGSAHPDAAPPPLGAHAPDIYRITIAGGTTASIPPAPTVYVRVPHGPNVGLLLRGPGDADGPHEAFIGVRPNGERQATHWHGVTAGDVVTDYGVRIEILKVWRMPNWANNAVDVQADPAG